MQRRQFLQRNVAGALWLAAGLPARAMADDTGFDAWVSLLPGRGAPVYPSVGAALSSAPTQASRPFRIGIDVGVWHEKLVIDRPHVHLIGRHRHATVLQSDTAAGTRREDGEAGGTRGSACVRVTAPGFAASRLTLANAFDYRRERQHPSLPATGPNGAQAVALMLDQGADRAWLHEVDLVGHQDTLFVDAGRSLFQRCRISGSVDFVFGAGRAYFEQCDLVSRWRADQERQGWIAAPSTARSQPQGLVFARCRLLREARVPDASVALGRAWRPGRRFEDGRYGDPDAVGNAVFAHCWMDAHIAPEGWDPMGYTARDGTRVMLDPLDARLYEAGSHGPGAHRNANRRVLAADDLARYSRDRTLQGWEVGRVP